MLLVIVTKPCIKFSWHLFYDWKLVSYDFLYLFCSFYYLPVTSISIWEKIWWILIYLLLFLTWMRPFGNWFWSRPINLIMNGNILFLIAKQHSVFMYVLTMIFIYYNYTLISIYWWTFHCFYILDIINNAAVRMGIHIYFKINMLYILNKYPEAKLLNHMFWCSFYRYRAGAIAQW